MWHLKGSHQQAMRRGSPCQIQHQIRECHRCRLNGCAAAFIRQMWAKTTKSSRTDSRKVCSYKQTVPAGNQHNSTAKQNIGGVLRSLHTPQSCDGQAAEHMSCFRFGTDRPDQCRPARETGGIGAVQHMLVCWGSHVWQVREAQNLQEPHLVVKDSVPCIEATFEPCR